jgi:hypothetical protein
MEITMSGPECGHSACSQNYIDNGETKCIRTPCPECDGPEQEDERLDSDDYTTPCHLCGGDGYIIE